MKELQRRTAREAEISFRSMTMDDIEMIARIERESFTSPWSKEAFRIELTQNHFAQYMILERNGETIGYGGMWLIVDEAHITNIAIREPYRGQGLGERLLREIMRTAAWLGALRITLEVRVSNDRAQSLYRKLGFYEAGIRPRYYSDNQEDALIMWAELAAAGAAEAQETPDVPARAAAAEEQPYCLLAIETSCDETSVAIVRDGVEVLVNLVSSQIETHRQFGGVVPEIASRKHVESITVMLEEAVRKAGIGLDRIDAIAVTQGPGLVGALLVGVIAAKSLALALDVPLIGTHHIAGHIYANRLVGEIVYPALALVVSGGHTELVLMEREGSFRIIGRTRDDAVGEAYDKVARALEFPYPGGPHVDRLAHEADAEIELPRAWLEADSFDFSFSGLKSAVLAEINRSRMKGETPNAASLAKGFQASVIDVVAGKAMKAADRFGVRQMLLCGGVAANRGLRARLAELCAAADLPLLVPPPELCTDNAAMIAAAADLKWRRGAFTPLDMKADPQLSLEAWSV